MPCRNSHTLKRSIRWPDCPEIHKTRTPVSYRATVKLHGTNAGVQCSPEGLVLQSRSRVITVDEDNAGFAALIWSECRRKVEPESARNYARLAAKEIEAAGLPAITESSERQGVRITMDIEPLDLSLGSSIEQ